MSRDVRTLPRLRRTDLPVDLACLTGELTLGSAIDALDANANKSATAAALATLIAERDALLAAVLGLPAEIGQCEAPTEDGTRCDRWFARVGPTRHGRRKRFCSNACKLRHHRATKC